MRIAGLLPRIYVDSPRTAVNIGLGTGMTADTLLASRDMERVYTVEIEAAVVDGAMVFEPRVSRSYQDDRHEFVIDDAKAFFSSANQQFDLIASEPSNPWISGVASLFTDEFYSDARRYMSDRSVFLQWIQLYELSERELASVFKALDKNFRDYHLFLANSHDLIVVAAERELDLDRLKSFDLASQPDVAEWQRLGVHNTEDLLARYVGDRALWSPFFQAIDARMNSDYHPILGYMAPKQQFKKSQVEAFTLLYVSGLPVIEMLGSGQWHDGMDQNLNAFPLSYGYVEAYLVKNRRFQSMEYPELSGALYAVDAGELCADVPDARFRLIVDELLPSTAVFMSREDGEAFWKRALARCSQANAPGAPWLRMLAAIASRNPEMMLEAADAIGPQKAGSYRASLLSGARLLALLASGRQKEATALVEASALDAEQAIHFRVMAPMASR